MKIGYPKSMNKSAFYFWATPREYVKVTYNG